MQLRRIAPLLLAPLVLIACGGDGDGGSGNADNVDTGSGDNGSSDNGSSDNGSSDNGSGVAVEVGGVTPAPVEGPLTMSVDQASLLSPDPAAGLSALGFPEGWLLPESADSIIGVHLSYSRGDDKTYTTFRTSYEVAGDDPEAVLEAWRTAFVDAFDIEVPGMSAHVSSSVGESWFVTSIGDVEPGKPEVEIEVAQLADSTRPLVLIVEYVTLDREFPEVVYSPTDIDPTLPSLDGCTQRRVDVSLDPEVDVTSSPDTPAYRLWWEGECEDSMHAASAEWANGYGFGVDPAVSDSFGYEATLPNGSTASLNVSLLDDGGTFFSLVIEQPLA